MVLASVVPGRGKGRTALSDQGDPSTYTLHGGYYDQGDPAAYILHGGYYLKDRDGTVVVTEAKDRGTWYLLTTSRTFAFT